MKKLAKKKKVLSKKNATPQGYAEDKRLLGYLSQWRELMTTLGKLEQQTKEVKERIRNIEENYLPNLLMEFGTTRADTADGVKVELKNILTASVAKRNEKEAVKILKRINATDIITAQVSFVFDKKSAADMKRLLTWSREVEIPCAENHSVIGAAALKNTVQDRLNKGLLKVSELPTLGVHMVRQAKITEPKKK